MPIKRTRILAHSYFTHKSLFDLEILGTATLISNSAGSSDSLLHHVGVVVELTLICTSHLQCEEWSD